MKKNLIYLCVLMLVGDHVYGIDIKDIAQKGKAKVQQVLGKGSTRSYASMREPGGCNGYLALCNRRYNEVAYAYSHNGTALGPSIVNNQDISLKDLMNRGVRGTKFAVHWARDLGNKNGQYPTVCHGIYRAVLYEDYYKVVIGRIASKLDGFFKKIQPAMKVVGGVKVPGMPMKVRDIPAYMKLYFDGIKPVAQMAQKALPVAYGNRNKPPAAMIPFTPCAIDPAARLLSDVLKDIKAFLDANPRDVFTITFENQVSVDVIAQEIVAIGLQKYVHVQDKTKPWPTLGEMVKTNKRLVMFARQESKAYPWFLLQSDYMWSPIAAEKETKESLLRAIKVPLNDANFRGRNSGPQNKLCNLPHHLTLGFGGFREAADEVNAKDFLRVRVNSLGNTAQVVPNYINTDFTERPKGDVFDVVDEINGVGKYAGRSMFGFVNKLPK